MTATVIVLSIVSLATLVLGLFAWRLTSSKPLIMNMIFGSVGFLVAAYGFASNHEGNMPFIIPFFATMLIMGRASGTLWRVFVRGEKELLVPSSLLGTAAVLCVGGTVMAFIHQ